MLHTKTMKTNTIQQTNNSQPMKKPKKVTNYQMLSMSRLRGTHRVRICVLTECNINVINPKIKSMLTPTTNVLL